MDFSRKYDVRSANEPPSDNDIISVLRDFSLTDVEAITPLPGGYANINLKITVAEKSPVVLRISRNPRDRFEAEIALLAQLADTLPVPSVHQQRMDHPLLNRHVALLAYVPGTPLHLVEDNLSFGDIQTIGAQLGSTLARIHAITFDRSGFLGKDVRVTVPFPSFHDGFERYFRDNLVDAKVRTRLPDADLLGLTDLLARSRDRLRGLSQTTSLVHSDFNQKNILVDRRATGWVLTGILDWEFAFAGSPLIDFGNFFRFEPDLPPGYKTSFVDAYRSSGGHLDADWQDTAQILDLLSIVEFLTRDGEYPKTFATARAVIAATLDRLRQA